MNMPPLSIRLTALVLPVLLGACAVSTVTGDHIAEATCSGPILDVSLAGDGYSIGGESFAADKLDQKVAAVHKSCPLTEVRLHPGDGTIKLSNMLAIGIAAKAIKATAFYEKDGELKGVVMVD